MSVNVYDLANELERSIRSLPEYQDVAKAKEEIAKDSQAKALWDEFTQVQDRVQGLLQSGQMPSQEDQETMQALGQKIEGNATLKVYFDAQQRLSVYMTDIERIIFKPLHDLVK
ncbi:YlbF/YmcA family competence regulator [Streptococcus sp. sy018]|uniref:YlbF/YmcA family competence regulator n=1 Tax=Streptococcus sp. sy018 TaxID=2600147 RepID=UPI0011B6C2BF|nr:YlbF/YmcA family competence regulator [Streptococcus sp. sy018]TWS95320.1 YlbF/YmcA family competence regulator [Streptococcus sp. sy018]